MTPPLAAIDSGWAAAFGTLLLAVGTVIGLFLEQRRKRRVEKKASDKAEAEAPALELSATSKAAEAIARAAASLIAPFQNTIADLQRQVGELRGEVATARAAAATAIANEEHCQADLRAMRSKLREVTDHLGLDPDAQS